MQSYKRVNGKMLANQPQISSSIADLGFNRYTKIGTVPAESAKMARKLTFGNYRVRVGKKLNSCGKVV